MVIQSTAGGEWTWTHGPGAVTTYNVYSGATFENITFMGNNDDSAGGLWLQSCNNRVVNCSAYRYKAGTGFRTEAIHDTPNLTASDASWTYWESCYAVDCLYGFDMGGDTPSGSSGGEMVQCITFKTGNPNAVAQHTGWGFRLSSSNYTMLGGKAEKEGVGVLVRASNGVSVMGTRTEGCAIAFHLDRDSGIGFPGSIQLIGIVPSNSTTRNVHIGANQWGDLVVGGLNGSWLDEGRATRIISPSDGDMIKPSSVGGAVQTFVGRDGITALTTKLHNGGNITHEITSTTFGAGVFFRMPNHNNTFFRVTNGTNHIIEARGDNKLGLFGATPVVKPTVTGSKGSNAALASLLTALANLGLITNSSS